jgi:hypothetical protein
MPQTVRKTHTAPKAGIHKSSPWSRREIRYTVSKALLPISEGPSTHRRHLAMTSQVHHRSRWSTRYSPPHTFRSPFLPAANPVRPVNVPKREADQKPQSMPTAAAIVKNRISINVILIGNYPCVAMFQVKGRAQTLPDLGRRHKEGLSFARERMYNGCAGAGAGGRWRWATGGAA